MERKSNSYPSIFPAGDDDGLQPYRDIALFVGCHEHDVGDAFTGVGVPEYVAPEHLKRIQTRTAAANKAAGNLYKVIQELRTFPDEFLNELVCAGTPTLAQLEFLHVHLLNEEASLERWRSQYNQLGGRNPAAYAVAEGVRRLFRSLRRPITHGLTHYGNGPSTDFGKTVQYALAAFCIRADWRRPAEEARDKQRVIEERFSRMQDRRKQKEETIQTESAERILASLGVRLEIEGEAPRTMVRISLPENPDIPDYCLPLDQFGCGRRLRLFAADWAKQMTSAN